MAEMTKSIKMLACDTAGGSSTPIVDGPSKARRVAFKIVEAILEVGEVDDAVLLTATTIFQDSIKTEMLLNLADRRMQRAYLNPEIKCLQ
ncbi:hypothetical protein AMTR_s00023p00178700 [Amborella trichopoda]|uniref:Uncharacterized protein n=1 Tax=Amborella trichopoda TaxID=13333 RepID=W1NJF6_AMBTC|nr:hypothetical protein AMTR_s00023p00178700 [Amborella trichopoda]